MAPAQDGGESTGGIGRRLKSARELAGLSPVEAAERMHVDTVVLQALEAEQFDQLGAPVYVRGYIRHYADLVGESPAELEDLYASSLHASRQPDLTRIPRAEREGFSRTLVVPGIVVVIAVALIGVGWWIAAALNRSAKLRRVAVAAATQSIPGTRLTAGHTAPHGAPVPASVPAANTAAPVSAAPPESAEPVSTGRAAAPLASLTIHFSANCWTEVYDARGDRLFYDIGHAGSTRTLRGVPPLRLVLGNAPAVSLELNGKPVKTPPVVGNVVVQWQVQRSGRVARIKRPRAGRTADAARTATRSGPPTAVGSGTHNPAGTP